MKKNTIKNILENHLEMLSKISDEDMIDNPILLCVVTEALKTTTFTLMFIDKIWHILFCFHFADSLR